MFYPLHVHTAGGSIGDSILKIDDYIQKAKNMGLDHLAVTNHGSMADMYEFYYKCKKAEITPIIGCEVYITDQQSVCSRGDSSHLVLLAKNNVGLKNLLYIVSDASLNGMYYKPRTDLNIIKKHSEGLIAFSACVGGEIPKLILATKDCEEAEREKYWNQVLSKINDYQNVFEEFYLEIQPGIFEDQVYVNKILQFIHQEYDIPIIITNDIHYLDHEDAFIHNAHICIERKIELTEELLYRDDCYYLMDQTDAISKMSYLDKDVLQEAFDNTQKVAMTCQIALEIEKLDMPSVPIPKQYNEDEYLAYLTFKALNDMVYEINNPIEYMDRALYELNVLKVLGFSGYFLTIKDKIDYAKSNHIPVGPGRGSVCGLKNGSR